jgi:hypothetical protein
LTRSEIIEISETELRQSRPQVTCFVGSHVSVADLLLDEKSPVESGPGEIRGVDEGMSEKPAGQAHSS